MQTAAAGAWRNDHQSSLLASFVAGVQRFPDVRK